MHNAERVRRMPGVVPARPVDLVDAPLRLVDRVDPALGLDDHTRVVLIHGARPSLRRLARDRQRSVVDPVARVHLDRALVRRDVELDARVVAVERERRLLVAVVENPGVVEACAACPPSPSTLGSLSTGCDGDSPVPQ